MPINFSSKKVFVRKIRVKENDSYYFFEGEFNIKENKSYIKIEKLKFDQENYKELYSKQLKDILTFSDSNINEKQSPLDKKDENKENENLTSINYKSLKEIQEINSLFGFIKFNMGYYAILACDSEIQGKIERNIIYRVNKLFYLPLFEIDESFKKSTEYYHEKKYFNLARYFSYDKQLYFSYSYNLTNTVQRNFVQNFKKEMVTNFEKESEKKDSNKISLNQDTNYYFCWNYFHIEEFFNLIIEQNRKNEYWINYFIYGYFGQKMCNIKGIYFQISVIARRNRHFAGTRYLKRGIASDGNVANDVETEQVLEEVIDWIERPKISSFIQIRGSIPVYWSQIQNFVYEKPEIKVNLSDIRYEATKRHFSSLIERYGVPTIVFNLARKTEEGKKQETLLNDLFSKGVKYINSSIKDFEKILYYHYDLKIERIKRNFYKQFYEISCPLISKTNLFSFVPDLKNKYNISLQNGVIRTNCIDCLDRTNVFQQILGIAVLIIQLRLMGIKETFPENENETIYGSLNKMYKEMGHDLSIQYTGTLAIKQTITENRNLLNKFIDIGSDIAIAIKRSINNFFNDQAKQNAMNLFLGKYKVNSGEPLIWKMPCDDTLHKNRHLPILPPEWYKINYRNFCKFNLFKDIEDQKLENEIYIRKNVDEENINNINNETNSKMSITAKLICNSLFKDQTDFKLIEDNYTNSNINEYIIDYAQYFLNKNKTEEEKKFEEDSIYRFILEIQKKEKSDYISYFDKRDKIQNVNEETEDDVGNNGHKEINVQKANSFIKSGNDKFYMNINSQSPIPFHTNNESKLRTDIKKLGLYSFEITKNDFQTIGKFSKPLSNNSVDQDIFELDNFDITEEDMNKMLNDQKKKFEKPPTKEEKKNNEINSKQDYFIYYEPNTNKIYYNDKNTNIYDDFKEDEKKMEEEKNIEEGDKQDSEERKSIKREDSKEKENNSSNEERKKEENENQILTMKKVIFAPFKIEEDYFEKKEKKI